MITTEDLYLIVNNNTETIKQVFWESKEVANEEVLYNVQSLILGLDSSISLKEANDFIFVDKTFKEFGSFIVEFVIDKNGIKFSISPK